MKPRNAVNPASFEPFAVVPVHRVEAFRFGAFTLNTQRGILQQHGQAMSIGSRALIVLTTLVEARGGVVDHEALMMSAWPSTFVDEANLRVQISTIRRILGKLPGPASYIESLTGQGYRIGIPVQPIHPLASEGAIQPPGSPPSGCQNDRCVHFGSFCFDPTRQVLLDQGTSIRLGIRAMAILSALISRAGEIVANEDLVRLAWPDMVDDVNLRVHLAAVRRALRDSAENPKFVANVSGRGYRFVAPLLAGQSEYQSQS